MIRLSSGFGIENEAACMSIICGVSSSLPALQLAVSLAQTRPHKQISLLLTFLNAMDSSGARPFAAISGSS